MGANEEATVRDLKGHQAVVLPMVSEHDGRVIDTAGDGILGVPQCGECPAVCHGH
jgi:class 3 adenylate cyclase